MLGMPQAATGPRQSKASGKRQSPDNVAPSAVKINVKKKSEMPHVQFFVSAPERFVEK